MSSGRRFQDPRSRFFRRDGLGPVSAGRVTFYRAGTTQLVDTYSDAAKTTAHPNPMTLDSNGYAPGIIYFQDFAYDIRIEDDKGALDDLIENYLQPESAVDLSSVSVAGVGTYTGQSGVTIDGVNIRADTNFLATRDSPSLTGTPTAPTQSTEDSSTKLATTAFTQQLAAIKSDLNSPSFTGTPTAPTQDTSDRSTKIASTQFVGNVTQVLAPKADPTFTGRVTVPDISASPLNTDAVNKGYVDGRDALKAPLVSPSFTGIARLTTPTFSATDDRIVTAEWVQNKVAPIQAVLADAQSAAADASDEADEAETNKDLAREYALRAEDLQISGVTGEYSALHYRNKTQTLRDEVVTAKDATQGVIDDLALGASGSFILRAPAKANEAAASATSAATSETNATTQATAAATSATSAAASEGEADSAATIAVAALGQIENTFLPGTYAGADADARGVAALVAHPTAAVGAIFIGTDQNVYRLTNVTTGSVAADLLGPIDQSALNALSANINTLFGTVYENPSVAISLVSPASSSLLKGTTVDDIMVNVSGTYTPTFNPYTLNLKRGSAGSYTNETANTTDGNDGTFAQTSAISIGTSLGITEASSSADRQINSQVIDTAVAATGRGGNTVAGNTITLSFYNFGYFGTSTSTNLNEAGIEALTAYNATGSSRTASYTVGGSDAYLYWAVPTSLGASGTAVIDGFEVAVDTVGTVSVTNSASFVENYTVYRVAQIQPANTSHTVNWS